MILTPIQTFGDTMQVEVNLNKTRQEKIDHLVRSFDTWDGWVKNACLHSMGVPKVNRNTGKPWQSFREILEAAADETVDSVYEDTAFNGDLV